ncbi:hypothetical protein SLS62_007831 [Diatrype stigma]|uniref:Uncharacterized protein n=1 Tax=Diatrype stigma TaxID=117547 RepID=A0AAN9UN74_9PEZI
MDYTVASLGSSAEPLETRKDPPDPNKKKRDPREHTRVPRRPGSERSLFEEMLDANRTASRAQANTFRESLLFRDFRDALSDVPPGDNQAAQHPDVPIAARNEVMAPLQVGSPQAAMAVNDVAPDNGDNHPVDTGLYNDNTLYDVDGFPIWPLFDDDDIPANYRGGPE